MKVDAMIEVLVALRDGKIIQFKAKDRTDGWLDLCAIGTPDFKQWDYRIKPQPQEWYLCHMENPPMVFDTCGNVPCPRCVLVREVVE